MVGENSSPARIRHRDPSTEQNEIQQCPDVLSGMSRGTWKTRALSNEEVKAIDIYLREERKMFKIPRTFQREDELCGNVSYELAPRHNHMLFKAICDWLGSSPCCRGNQ